MNSQKSGWQIALDDFGLSEKANRNILKLILVKKIGRISVMADGDISQGEAEMLLSSGVKLDIHLHANEDIKKNKKNDGTFGRIFIFLAKYILGKNRPKKIERIWEKQILEFQSKFQKNPDGLNSHEHIHFFPPYFKIALKLCEKYDIKYIRLGSDDYKNFNLISITLNFLRIFNKKYLKKSSLASSEFLVSADWIENLDFKEYKNKSNAYDLEIVFHPEKEYEFAFLDKFLPNRENNDNLNPVR